MKFPAIIAGATLVCACTGSESSRPVLIASLPQTAEVVRQVAGPEFEVAAVATGGADPETFEPSQSLMRRVSRARAFFTTGTLPFEQSVAPALPVDAYCVDIAEDITPITGTHADAHMTDPHVWASLANLSAMAGEVADYLAVAVPDSAGAYRGRARALQTRLGNLSAEADSVLAAAGRPAFGVWHPSLSYFARDYGLRQVSVGAEHRELSPRQMRQAVDSLRSAGVAILFYDHPGQAAAAAAVAQDAGATPMLIEASPADYPAYLLQLAHIIADGTGR